MMSKTDMQKNVEIKANVSDEESILSKCKAITKSEGVVLFQEDHFFPVEKGRLKMRFQGESSAELIFYDRSDIEGPKLSSYQKCSLPNGKDLLNVLNLALGKKGCVKKKRHLFMIGQTRVHIDSVDGLGSFMELEVVLQENQEVLEGVEIAKKIMHQLGVKETDLISKAYIDLM